MSEPIKYFVTFFRSGKCHPNPIAPEFHPSMYKGTERKFKEIIHWYIMNEDGNKYENHHMFDSIQELNANDPLLNLNK